MAEAKNPAQKIIMRCLGCLSTVILVLPHLDFKFKETVTTLPCIYCGLKKYTMHESDTYSLIGPAHPQIKCEKCSSSNVSYLGNDICFCLECFEFFKK